MNFTWLRRKTVIIGGSVVILAAGSIVYGVARDDALAFVQAQKTTLVQEVQLTGAVTPTQKVELAFERSGRVNYVYVKVGARVRRGQLLALQSNASGASEYSAAKARLEGAQATLEQYKESQKGQQAKLDELQAGARKEDLYAQDTEIAKALTALDDARANLSSYADEAYIIAEKAMRVQLAGFFVSNNTSYKLTFETCDVQAKSDSEWERMNAENLLRAWEQVRGKVVSRDDDVLQAHATRVVEYLRALQVFIDIVARTIGPCNESNPVMITHRTTLATVRDALRTQANKVITANNAIDAEKLTIQKLVTQRKLNATSARDEQIAAQKAQVAQAESQIASQKAQIKASQSNVSSAAAVLSQGVIRAPFEGIITKVDAKAGQIANGFVSVIAMMSMGSLQVEGFIPETDLTKVHVGQEATITLDAYGDETIFPAQVTFIDPAETVIQGVATYKVTIRFTQQDDRVKSGMTANVTIRTATRENTLAIPERIIATADGVKTVRVLTDNNKTQEIRVVTGIRGNNGLIEVKEGLKEGDRVITKK